MKRDAMQTRVGESAEPASAQTPAETNYTDGQPPYWGVVCRTCGELVAFDASPYESFGPEAASTRPGAIRCRHGHTHIYFPRDFGFRASTAPIADTAMRENRDVYRATNSLGQRTSHDYVPRPVAEEAEPGAGDGESEDAREGGKARPAKIGPDPRREAAREAAKRRWKNWAARKAG
jgi:hypothetical protein